MVMGLIQVSLLVLGAVMLADAEFPHSVKWQNPRSPWSPGTYYSQNQVQAFSPYDSSMTPWGYGRIEPNRVLNMPQPPVTFYPRGFREESAVNPGQKPEQHPVQDRVQHPAEQNVQTPGRPPSQDPVSTSPQLPSLVSGPNPPAWNLVQTPVAAPVWKPVLAPVQESAPSPLPVPVQAPAEKSNLNNVPVWNPVQNPLPVPAQNLSLPSGPNAAVLSAPDPVYTPVPVPPQNFSLLSGPSTGLGPANVPVPVPAQNPPLPSGPSSVLLPAQDQRPASVPMPLQSLPQLSGPNTDPGQASGMSPALTSSPSNVLLTPPQASPWTLGQTPAQSPGQSSAQAPNPTLYPDPLKSLQLQVHLPTEPLKKLMWRFPKAPERPKQFPVQFNLRQPTPVNSVAAACGESMVHVEVKQDFFGNGKLINPNSLTLGGCAAAGLDSAARVLIFNSELQACGSVLMMTEDYLTYSFHLLYHPEPLVGTSIVRTGSVNVQIECHYSRKHNVSSIAVAPTWVPYSSTVAAEEHLVFTLKLMTDDWQYERPSNQYFLGEFMKIEASLTQFNHVPLRVFVDRCVATAVPDINAVPRYSFIENHGCLVDAKITGSNSEFMKRVQDNKLQFQLEVFRFEQGNSSMLYVTCFLKASTTLQKTDAEHKACSFEANRWAAADGNDQDCNCCDGECVPTDEGQYFETQVSLGPILVEDDDYLLQ